MTKMFHTHTRPPVPPESDKSHLGGAVGRRVRMPPNSHILTGAPIVGIEPK